MKYYVIIFILKKSVIICYTFVFITNENEYVLTLFSMCLKQHLLMYEEVMNSIINIRKLLINYACGSNKSECFLSGYAPELSSAICWCVGS